MRKKISVVSMLTIVFYLVVGTGVVFATPSFADYAQTVLIKEKNTSQFSAWSTADKIELVLQLINSGYLDKHDTLAENLLSAPEPEAGKHAEEMLVEWFGRPIEYPFTQIMDRVWGNFRFWTPAQKAWFTDSCLKAGLLGDDHERYVLPNAEHLSAEDAIEIAKGAATFFFGITAETINQYSVTADFMVFPIRQVLPDSLESYYTTEGVEPEWLITFSASSEVNVRFPIIMGSVDPMSGKFMYDGFLYLLHHHRYSYAPLPNSLGSTIIDTYSRLSPGSEYEIFFRWPLDAKAAWSEDMRTDISQASPSEVDFYTNAISIYQYGLPDRGAMKDTNAYRHACQALAQQYGISENKLSGEYEVYTYYDVTNADKPLWRFCFDQTTKMDIQQRNNYRIEICARDGIIVSMEKYSPDHYSGYEAIIRLL